MGPGGKKAVAPQERTDNGDSTGFGMIEVSDQALFWIIVAMVILLTINLLVLCYINDHHRRPAQIKHKYSKVDVIVSSDKNLHNLKEIDI